MPLFTVDQQAMIERALTSHERDETPEADADEELRLLWARPFRDGEDRAALGVTSRWMVWAIRHGKRRRA